METPLLFPAVTSLYAGILALLFAALSIWVVVGRVQTDTMQGSGSDALARRIGAQGNFAQYVPFALLLMGLLEASGAGHALIHGLGLVLLLSRLAHPFGMLAPNKSPQQYVCRGGGIFTTLGVIAVAALALIARAS